MILFSIEEFTARRREAQSELEAKLLAAVRAALDHRQDTGGWNDLLSLVARLYSTAYNDESGGRGRHPLPRGFRAELLATLRKTKDGDENSVERISTWLATAILSRSTIEASIADDDELFLEWVTMGDTHVRETHQDANGQVQPIGDKYHVGGAEMRYPGDPTVAIELWINCRCTLRPRLASEVLTAGGTMPSTSTVNTNGPVITWTPTAPPVEPGQDEAAPPEDTQPVMEVRIPWHGVLAPEGIPSGDGRMFAADSLRNRDLPLPLTWQKASSDGHAGSVTVATIEKIERLDGMMRGSGYFLASPEADEVVGLISEFGKFGVSVDADDATMEIDEANEMVVFTSARIASASIVAIPAFAEAYVAIGPWDDADITEPLPTDALAAAAFGRGPGWITNPVETKRIHDYWTVPGEPGYAKIGWGVPGDFNRCRVEVGEEIGENSPDKLRFLNQICAQWHHDALGIWPGQEMAAADTLTDTAPAEALNLVASVGHIAPAAWFTNPNLDHLTPLTVTDEGRVFGHLAGWDTCHIGFKDTCTAPPQSETEYAYFLTGQVALDNGSRANTGSITLGGGHADPRVGLRAAVEHYDSTSAVVADITVGDDDHGIWFAGWVRPGVTNEQITALRASPLSGDWRRVGSSLELVAALAVNTPGFPIPRTQIAASGAGQLSLVASGIVTEDNSSIGFNSDVDTIVAAVAREVRAQEQRRQKMAALAEKVGQ